MPEAHRELHSVNPATEAEIQRYRCHNREELNSILDSVVVASREWAVTDVNTRCQGLVRLAEELRGRQLILAGIITAEMGKPISEALAEVEKCAGACEYFALNAAAFLADVAAPSDSSLSRVSFEPLGVVLAGMPWNYPLWQVIRCAAPALVAGNGLVLKHANNTTGCALALEAAMGAAGLPPSLFRSLIIPIEDVASVIADRRIAAVSLTGSTAAGRAVGEQAGRHLKKCVLELGGSDAFIVLEDADIAAAAACAVRARFQNNGQSCIAAKRFIVVDSVAAAFTEALAAEVSMLVLGDPDDPETDLGPLARDDLRQAVEAQLHSSLGDGARLVCGGGRPRDRGYYLEPTVIADCPADCAAFQQETFGPLAAIATVADETAAVALANRSDYGLGGNVWTGDAERGLRLARRLETGGVFINGMTHSDARLPFGGIKHSGYGRELHRFGIQEFVNVKTVWLAEESGASRA